MIASLAMYEREQTKELLNTLWSYVQVELHAQGIDAPNKLTKSAADLEFWARHDLVLSQTCGLPYRAALHDRVHLVASPIHNIDGCPSGYYRSAIVIRANDIRIRLHDFSSAKIICNNVMSQSGYAALKANWLAEELLWPELVIFSGSHSASARTVAAGGADIAAIDAVTWQLIKDYDDFAQDLKVLTWTEPTPALPFICALQFDSDSVASALSVGINRLTDSERQTLRLFGIAHLGAGTYHAIPTPPECRP